MKKFAAMLALILGSGFLATSQFKDARREKDLRSLTVAEAQTLAALVEQSKSPDWNVRLKAVRGLESFNSLRTLPILVVTLSDPSEDVVVASITALQSLDQRIGRTGCRVLASLCSDPRERIRKLARRALPELADWRAAPILLEEAARPSCNCRALIYRVLQRVTGHSVLSGKSGGRPEFISARLEKILTSGDEPDAPLSEAESKALQKLWTEWYERYKDKTPVDWLSDDLESGAGEPVAIMAALVRLDAKATAPLLVKFLQGKDQRAVTAAAKALRSFEYREALAALVEAAPGANRSAWGEISGALDEFCKRGDAALLLRGLEKTEGAKFNFFNHLLEKLTATHAPAAAESTQETKNAVEYWQRYVKENAGLTDAEAWAAALKSESAADRLYAVKNLAGLGEAGAPLLISAMEDNSEAVRRCAEKALRKTTHYYFEFDPLAPPMERARAVGKWREWWAGVERMDTFSRLVSILQNRCETARHRADAAMGLKDLDDWRAIPHLIAALEEEPEGLRHYAGAALRGITGVSFENEAGDEAETAAQWRKWWLRYRGRAKEFVLLSTIGDITEAEGIRLGAIARLASMGYFHAVPYLVDLLENESYLIRTAAEEALEKITGKSFFYSPSGQGSDCAASKATWLKWLSAQTQAGTARPARG